MLLLARLDQHEAEQLREPVLLQRSAAEVLGRFRERDPGRTYELRTNTHETLVDVQPGWLARVIENLVGNAAKYAGPGSPVTVEIESDPAGVRLTVLDEGPGVDEEDLERVFEPFFRTDEARQRAGGSGLGLAVSPPDHRAARRHDPRGAPARGWVRLLVHPPARRRGRRGRLGPALRHPSTRDGGLPHGPGGDSPTPKTPAARLGARPLQDDDLGITSSPCARPHTPGSAPRTTVPGGMDAMTVRRGSLYLGAFLVAAGGVTLLTSAGVLDPARVVDALAWWPVAVIAIGAALVLRRTSAAIPAGLVAAVTPGLLLGATFVAVPDISTPCTDAAGGGTPITREGAFGTTAEVDLELSCGELAVTTAPGSTWSIEATNAADRAPQITSSTDQLAVSTSANQRFGWHPGSDDWNVVLPTDTTLDLDATINAGRGRLDLSGARLDTLGVDVNAGDMRVDLADATVRRMDVSVNAGATTIHPPGLRWLHRRRGGQRRLAPGVRAGDARTAGDQHGRPRVHRRQRADPQRRRVGDARLFHRPVPRGAGRHGQPRQRGHQHRGSLQVNPRRLYRSRTDRTIAGVAGGMADYLEVDPTIVRILWILAAIFTGGLLLLLYILLAFVVPTNPYPAGAYPGGPTPAGAGYAPGAPAGWGQPPTAPGAATWSPDWNAQYEAERAARAERPGRAGLIIGTVLIVFGVIALADVALPSWIGGALFGPAILLAIGAALLVVSLRKPDAPVAAPSAAAATSGTSGYRTAQAGVRGSGVRRPGARRARPGRRPGCHRTRP